MLDLNITLVFQLVNFFIALYVLNLLLIRPIREIIRKNKLSCDVEIDGGINAETVKLAKAAGANVIVAGSGVFKAENRAAAIEALRNL